MPLSHAIRILRVEKVKRRFRHITNLYKGAFAFFFTFQWLRLKADVTCQKEDNHCLGNICSFSKMGDVNNK